MRSDPPIENAGQSARTALPLPPFALRERVGGTTFQDSPIQERQIRKASWWHPDPAQAWLRQGRFLAGLICDHVPADVDLIGARVLDFGCGAGRVLRHLVDVVGEDGELHGVDIDRPSIDWVHANASPALLAECCDEVPGLPYPDEHFELVYAMSVFTHLVEHWAGWLLELRRVLKPGGVLVATVIGRTTSAALGLAPADAQAPGMYVRLLGNEWHDGGPVTIHDAAWVAERWGRAFEIESHAARATGEPWPHDVVVARPRTFEVSEDELLAPGADGEADGMALAAQLRLLRTDALLRRDGYEHRVRAALDGIGHSRAGIEARATARLAELAERHAALEREVTSLDAPGWRVSLPGRALARLRTTASGGDAP